MTAESSGKRKFAKLMTHHILSNQQRYMLPPIVDRNCKPTNSGMMTDRRDQVLIGRRELSSFAFVILDQR